MDVTDTGIGIPEEEQGRIFGRFYRGGAVRAEEGVGIGLYLVREILRRQGGYVKVASHPGQGTGSICLNTLNIMVRKGFCLRLILRKLCA